MSAAELASYALSAVGLLVIASAMIAMVRSRINVTMANEQLVKLAKADNIDRAYKLTKAVSGTYFDAVGAAIAAIPRDSRDSIAIAASMQAAYDEVGSRLTRQWAKRVERGWLGAIVVGGGVGLATSGSGATTQHIVAGGLAVLAVVWLLGNRAYVANALTRTQREVIPVFVEAAAKADTSRPSASKPPPATASPPPREIQPLAVTAPLAATAPSLRDGKCPLCKATEIKTVDRGDPRFRTLVCSQCGLAQEFADLGQL